MSDLLVPLSPLILIDAIVWCVFASMWMAGAPFWVVAMFCGLAIFATAGLVAIVAEG